MKQLQGSSIYDGERYEVALPWKQSCTGLEDNKQQDMSRLVKLENRLFCEI